MSGGWPLFLKGMNERYLAARRPMFDPPTDRPNLILFSNLAANCPNIKLGIKTLNHKSWNTPFPIFFLQIWFSPRCMIIWSNKNIKPWCLSGDGFEYGSGYRGVGCGADRAAAPLVSLLIMHLCHLPRPRCFEPCLPCTICLVYML